MSFSGLWDKEDKQHGNCCYELPTNQKRGKRRGRIEETMIGVSINNNQRQAKCNKIRLRIAVHRVSKQKGQRRLKGLHNDRIKMTKIRLTKKYYSPFRHRQPRTNK